MRKPIPQERPGTALTLAEARGSPVSSGVIHMCVVIDRHSDGDDGDGWCDFLDVRQNDINNTKGRGTGGVKTCEFGVSSFFVSSCIIVALGSLNARKRDA